MVSIPGQYLRSKSFADSILSDILRYALSGIYIGDMIERNRNIELSTFFARRIAPYINSNMIKKCVLAYQPYRLSPSSFYGEIKELSSDILPSKEIPAQVINRL